MIDLQSPFVKICGLRELEHARVAAQSGASALGFILAPSRREVTPAHVREVKQALRDEGIGTPVVGVMVNLNAAELVSTIEEADVDLVQLSGDESIVDLPEMDIRFYKVVRFPPETSLDVAKRAIEPWLTHPRSVEFVMIDSFLPGVYGGSGHVGDWELAGKLAKEFPILLAGGLNPTNVAEAIATVQPFGVDVAGGVEEDGQKSSVLIESFMGSSREAFRNL